MTLKTLFFGTPDFAVPTLEAMAEAGYCPELVIAQPARRAGRGRKLVEPPVARRARGLGIAVRQPETVRDRAFLDELEALEPDLAVVVAYGQIFRRRLLELPRLGCVNVHASLLPKLRGAAPIQWAIAEGLEHTGVTTMQMARGLDSGPILLQEELGIGADETAAELSPRLAVSGASLLVRTLRGLEAGELESREQDADLATFAPRLDKADGQIDWRLAASRVYDRLRAFDPWPGSTTELRGEPLKVLSGRPLEVDPRAAWEEPGTLLGLRDARLAVACGGGSMFGLERVQRPGKKPVAARDFYNGEHLAAGDRLSLPPADPS